MLVSLLAHRAHPCARVSAALAALVEREQYRRT